MTDAAALERLSGSPRPRVLFVSHAHGGGVARHIQDLAASLANDAEVLLLQPHLRSFTVLRWMRAAEDLSIWWRTADEWDRAVELLGAIGVDRVHFHHVHGLPQAVLELPRRLGCAHDVTLHDFFPACPAYHLTGAGGRYCGGDARCQRCLDAGPAQWPLSIDEWRAAFGELLAGAQRVIAPSQDAAQRIQRFYPRVNAVVWPHPEDEARAAVAPVRVLVPGAISPAKGLDLLEACARDAAARGLPLHFRVVGYLARAIPAWPELPFSVSGEYREADLQALIAQERGDVFFFPAQCPETFSYTLSAALASPLPIVATNLGALPERLAHRADARIVAWDASPGAINDALLACAAPRAVAAPPAAPRTDFAAYRERYAAALGPRRSPARTPEIEPRWLQHAHEHMPEWTLAGLFDDAVRRGRASSRDELGRRVGEADARLEALAAALAEARERLAQRDAELRARAAEAAARAEEQARLAARAGAAEERARAFERSRSWRVTAPLRAVVRWFGRGT